MSGGPWHSRSVADIAAALGTDPERGLEGSEAARRLAADGPNELHRGEATSPLATLAAQFQSLVVWVLIGAALLSVALGEAIDGAAILAIVVLNAGIGFFQEFRAERALAALAKLAAPRARVVRDGRAVVVPSAEIVRGDVLLLEGGDLVGADARLVEAAALRAVEASLTGDSGPVTKEAEILADDTALADRRNMVFLGTSVSGGSGRALVVATGMATEVGHIANLLAGASSVETPLQRRLDAVGRRLLIASGAIVGVVFVLGLLRAIPLAKLFFTSVSLAVAAIPEGLPAVVTVALALGVSRMARRNALVRRLQAVETLGSASVICTDKTGILTVGEMTARRLVTPSRTYAVTGEGYATDGVVYEDSREADPAADPELRSLLEAAAGCVDAELGEREGKPVVVGDPTEGALPRGRREGGHRARRDRGGAPPRRRRPVRLRSQADDRHPPSRRGTDRVRHGGSRGDPRPLLASANAATRSSPSPRAPGSSRRTLTWRTTRSGFSPSRAVSSRTARRAAKTSSMISSSSGSSACRTRRGRRRRTPSRAVAAPASAPS